MRTVSRPKPKLFDLRVSALFELYRWRLSDHKVQELLAGAGIAIGVALFFGVLVANSSLINSASQLVHSVTGAARLQLVARSPSGFDSGLAEQVQRTPGVEVAAPVLRANATIKGAAGAEAIQLVGVTPRQIRLRGAVTRNLGAGSLLLAAGLGVPSSVANTVGTAAGGAVTLLAGGKAQRVPVRAVLGTQTIGAVANSPIVVALLPTVQRVLGLPGRITQVLVEPKPGYDRSVEASLRRLAAGRLDVLPADHELTVLKAAAEPTSQSTTLFAAISAMVGFLLALNAVLLTVPERRRFVAELRLHGFQPRQILLVLISQAIMLGLASSLVGLLLGDLLSHSLFDQAPAYLTLAFPIGTHPVVSASIVLLALGSGVVAATLASLLPLLDLRSQRRTDPALGETGEVGASIRRRPVLIAAVIGAALVVVVGLVALVEPSLSVDGGVALAVAAACLVLPIFVLVVRGLRPLSERLRGSMLALAVVELDATATRSAALAGVVALVVYGLVAVQGARHDLIKGLNAAVVQYLDTAQVWITPNNNFLTIDSFNASHARSRIATVPEVASVRDYQGALLDVGTRRLWIRARPPDDPRLIQASQLLRGNLARATALMRRGGWAVVSNGFAAERHLHVGDHFELATPSGSAPFGIAAITTNVGWPPGAITLNDNDFQRYWQTGDPTALEVDFRPGVTAIAGKHAIERALGSSAPGLMVETYAERKARFEESARQGIRSLSEISLFLVATTSLAIAAALSAAIWQRRARLASLKSYGFDSRQLWRSLVIESSILLAIGCLTGAALGVYGHALASRWLKLSIGFPAPFSLGLGLLGLTLALIVSIALAVVALPGLAAARVSPRVSFQE
jgi:putative ABC transport system permease protein